MKIIVSPAKKMKPDEYIDVDMTVPVFVDRAKAIIDYMKSLSFDELKTIWKCNNSVGQEAHDMIMGVNFENVMPAIYAYDGIAFKYIAPSVFENKECEYIQNNLRILSGVYGILKPFDGVVRYRLEMQAKMSFFGSKNLYDYWSDDIYKELTQNDDIIINLASKEYSKCVESYLDENKTFVTCIFGELCDDKISQKGVYAKMARGEMVRYLAVNDVNDIEGMKNFNGLGYEFSDKHSDDKTFVFLK